MYKRSEVNIKDEKNAQRETNETVVNQVKVEQRTDDR